MKEIPNIQFTVTISGPGDFATTARLLEIVLNHPPQDGFTLQVIRQRNRVADVVAKVKAGDVIALEDSDFDTAKRAVESYRWGSRHADLLKFAEQFGL